MLARKAELPLAAILPTERARVRRIAILVFPDAEIIDICGPLDAFTWADYFLRAAGRLNEPTYESRVVAAEPGPVRTQGGLEIIATHGYAEALDGVDTLIVVGGLGTEQACENQALIEWLRLAAPRVRRIASVCTGAFILAAAGLLKNRRVTTHWMYGERLAADYPDVCVCHDLIYIRDGHVYTSGGITSGIDLALSLIEEDLGRDIAATVARMMVVFLRRPGGQTQFSAFLKSEASRYDIRELQAYVLANPAHDLGVEALAERMAMSPRNFARLFRAETGTTPAKFVERARVEAARCKLEQTGMPMETIAQCCGFGAAERMRRSFQRLMNVAPQDYRERFQSSLGDARKTAPSHSIG